MSERVLGTVERIKSFDRGSKMRRLIAVATLVLSFSQMPTSVQANTSPRETPHLSTGRTFVAPVGFQIFCLQNANHCRGGGAAQINLSQKVLDVLKRVNGQVNRAISPRSDRSDTWSIGVSSGDCEDYVLAKRAALIKAGIAASALRIGLAKTRSGEGHAVLIVRTNEGDLVLDNMTSAIRRWDQSGLRWVAMTTGNGKSWQAVN